MSSNVIKLKEPILFASYLIRTPHCPVRLQTEQNVLKELGDLQMANEDKFERASLYLLYETRFYLVNFCSN